MAANSRKRIKTLIKNNSKPARNRVSELLIAFAEELLFTNSSFLKCLLKLDDMKALKELKKTETKHFS